MSRGAAPLGCGAAVPPVGPAVAELRRSRRSREFRHGLLAALLLGLAGAAPRAAQETPSETPAPALSSLRLRASLADGARGTVVRIEYRVTVAGEVLEPPTPAFELLGFGGALADSVRVAGRAFPLSPSGGTMRRAKIPGELWERDGRGGGDEAGGVTAFELEVAYEVRGAVDGEEPDLRARIPVLVPELAPAVGPETFGAEIELPAEWRVFSEFPSGLAPREPGVLAVSSRAPPAVIDFRARTDGTWRPDLAFYLMLGAGFLLVAVGAAAWRGLER